MHIILIFALLKHTTMTNNRLLILFAVMLFSFRAMAQNNTWIVDLNGGLDNRKYTPVNYSSAEPLTINGWSLNTAIGRHLSNHFVLGLLGGYGQQQEVDQYSYGNGIYDTRKYRITSWHVGAFGRYNYSISRRIFVYSQFSISKYSRDYQLISSTENYVIAPPSSYDVVLVPEGNGLIISVFPAIGFNILQGWGVHMDVGGIYYDRFNSTASYDRNEIKVNFGQSFSFGIHKIIGWKKYTPATVEGK